MRIVEYQRLGVDIRTLPLSRLRAIDIQTVEEEKEVAKIIAEKSAGIIPQDRVSIEDIKAKMDKEIIQRTLTKEKELEYQKQVDERVAKAISGPAEVAPEVPVKVSVETPKVEAVETPLVKKIRKLKKK